MKRNMKLALMGGTIGMLAGAGLLLYVYLNKSRTLVLTEPQVQSIVEGHFPIKQEVTVISIEYSNPKVSLSRTDNRMGMQLDLSGSILGRTFTHGQIKGTWTTRYESESGAIYFSDIQIDDIKFDGGPNEQIAQVKNVVAPFLSDRLKDILVYKLRDSEFTTFFARRILKRTEVKDGKLVIEFGPA